METFPYFQNVFFVTGFNKIRKGEARAVRLGQPGFLHQIWNLHGTLKAKLIGAILILMGLVVNLSAQTITTNWPSSALAWFQLGYTNDGVYTISPDGAGGQTISAYCLMSLAGGGWTRLTTSVANSAINTNANSTRDYLYVLNGTPRYYRTSVTSLMWSWSSGQDLYGTYYYSTGSGEGSFQINPSGEHQLYGIGGSSGGGRTPKCLIYYYSCQDAANAQVQICQDYPGIFGGSCACGVSVYIRETSVALPPFIMTQPLNQTVGIGANTGFNVISDGALPLSYQWYFNGVGLLAQTNATLSLMNVQLTNAGSYTVVVSNRFGTVTSAVASLRFPPPAIIVQSPQSVNIAIGSRASLSVSAGGSGPLTFQWYHDGQAILGANNSTLFFGSVQPSDQGSYTVVITNPGGTVTSPVATLNVLSYCAAVQTAQSIYPVGLPVPLNVTTFDCASGLPLTNKTVTVWIYKNGTSRTITVITGNTGGAVGYFSPFPNETGVYQIAAALPGQSAPAVQGTFTLIDPTLNSNQLVASPAVLFGDMIRGGQTFINFNLINTGGTNSGNIQVLLPSVPWLSIVTPPANFSLAPGQTNQIGLALTPGTNLDLGAYTGNIVITGTNTQVIVPFEFDCVSTQRGNLAVTVQDELSLWGAGSPNVSNATVVVTDFLTGSNVVTGITGSSGVLVFSNLASAYYTVAVSAPDHSQFRTTLLLAPSQNNNLTAFLSLQLVNYIWVVTPTTISNHYQFNLQTTFRTAVRWPVVTVSPGAIDLCTMFGQSNQISLTITNSGLIGAHELNLFFGTHPNWSISPAITNLGDLPAQSSKVVTLTIVSLGSATGVPDSIVAQLGYSVITTNGISSVLVPIYVYDANPADCNPQNPTPPPVISTCLTCGGGTTGGNTGSTGTMPTIQAPNYFFQTPQSVQVQVKLQIQQSAVIARNAFNATLQLVNNAGGTISNLTATLQVYDAGNNLVNSLFGIPSPALNNLNAVDGTGVMAFGANGTVAWTIVPANNAAPITPTQFFVGGSFSYLLNGELVSVPLFPVPITVLPTPILNVDYFLQHDVYGDDPFTPQIEPSIPFALGMLVKNIGYGNALDFTITSAQPQVIQNSNGLLNSFQLIGSQAGTNQSASPSLTLDLGDMNPQTSALGLWYLTSTLEGQFVSFAASYMQTDDLQNTNTSLINSVHIHELNHVVRLTMPTDDGLPDFLVNDTTNVDAPPNVVYSSDGSIYPVVSITNSVENGTPSSVNSNITVTVVVPTGWVSLEIVDPGANAYPIASVQRSDGVNLLVGPNVWQTPARVHMIPPKPNSVIHIFDYNSTGSYTITYGASNIVIIPATNYIMQAFQGQSAQLPVIKLINSGIVPPGVSLGISLPSTTSVLGGALQLNNGLITYTPPFASAGSTSYTDSFAYALTANSGATASGIVTVIVSNPTGGNGHVAVSGGQVMISFSGIPNFTYFIQASTNMADWVNIGTASASQSGSIQFTDVNAGQFTTRFYRTSATP